MQRRATIGDQELKKGDIVKPALLGEPPIYVVGFNLEKETVYGLKMTKEGAMDGRSRANQDGWNTSLLFRQLTDARILLRDVSMEDLNNGAVQKQIASLRSEPTGRENTHPVSLQNELVTRKVTGEEARKYGVKSILDATEWFLDPGVPNIATVGVNTTGLSLNELALQDMGIQIGEMVQVGFNPDRGALVIKKSDRGIRTTKNTSGAKVDNKRLADWLAAKDIPKKRFVLQYDQIAEVFYITIGG